MVNTRGQHREQNGVTSYPPSLTTPTTSRRKERKKKRNIRKKRRASSCIVKIIEVLRFRHMHTVGHRLQQLLRTVLPLDPILLNPLFTSYTCSALGVVVCGRTMNKLLFCLDSKFVWELVVVHQGSAGLEKILFLGFYSNLLHYFNLLCFFIQKVKFTFTYSKTVLQILTFSQEELAIFPVFPP